MLTFPDFNSWCTKYMANKWFGWGCSLFPGWKAFYKPSFQASKELAGHLIQSNVRSCRCVYGQCKGSMGNVRVGTACNSPSFVPILFTHLSHWAHWGLCGVIFSTVQWSIPLLSTLLGAARLFKSCSVICCRAALNLLKTPYSQYAPICKWHLKSSAPETQNTIQIAPNLCLIKSHQAGLIKVLANVIYKARWSQVLL